MKHSAEGKRPAHRVEMLVAFGVMQVVAYGAAGVVTGIPRNPPWPPVVAFGVILAQCSLAAAFAVFGSGKLWVRMICTGAVVVVGGLVIIMAEAPGPSFADVWFLVALFALLMWGINQVPLWMCRLFLRARTSIGDEVESNATRSQYGIRQLMGLTLAVALILGLGRWIVPEQIVTDLKDIRSVDWIVFASIAISAGLIVATTVIATLNPRYWRAGIIVSAVSAGLIACGIYSAFGLLSGGSTKDRILFAVLLLCTYGWLQISLLLVRAAGYRIVVRS